MKKGLSVFLLLVMFSALAFSVHAYDGGRAGHFRVGLAAPGLFVGNKNIDAMMSFGAEGEYFFLENLSASFRIEEATDFKIGDAPHSVFTFVARARYIFDIGSSGRWTMYVQGGGGGALIGSGTGAGDLAIPGLGIWYQWNDHWSFGADSSLHILIRNDTAIAFDITPVVRYQF